MPTHRSRKPLGYTFVATAAAVLLHLLPAVSGTCQLYQDSLTRCLSSTDVSRCGCEQLDTDMYLLHCNNRDLKSVPCCALDLSRSRLELYPVAGSRISSSALSINFSSNAIADLGHGCFASYVGHLSFYNEELELILSNNAITHIAAPVFVGVRERLRSLDISRNRLRKLKADDGHSPFAWLNLRVLDLSSNLVTDPCGLILSSATVLRLDNNQISALPANCFVAANGGIASLNLSGNTISWIAGEAFRNVRGLKELRLAGNRLPAMNGEGGVPWLAHLESIQLLDLSDNSIMAIDQLCRSDLTTVGFLDLSRNGLQSLVRYCFKNQSGNRSPLELRLDGNDVSAVRENSFDGLEERLTVLGLSSNGLTSIIEPAFHGLRALRSLDLSDNRLHDASFLCGFGTTSIRHISLRDNRLRTLLPPRREQGCFAGTDLSTLRALDLSGNLLKELPAGAFAFAPGLQTLDLSYNRLRRLLSGSFAGLASLKQLRLSGNALTRLALCAFVSPSLQPQSAAEHSQLAELHYDNNPLRCNCDGAWLTSFGVAVSKRGMGDATVAAPVRAAPCSSPREVRGRSIEASLSDCNDDSPLSSSKEVCAGLSLELSFVRGSLEASWSGVASDAIIYADLTSLSSEDVLVKHEQVATNGTYKSSNLSESEEYELCITALKNGTWQRDCVYSPLLLEPKTATNAGRESKIQKTAEKSELDAASSPMDASVVAAIVLAVMIITVIAGSMLLICRMRRRHDLTLKRCKPLSELRSREPHTSSNLSPTLVVQRCTTDSWSDNTQSSGMSLECGYIKEWTPMRRVILEQDFL